MTEDNNEKKLSSKITGLKFMQRKQERTQRALLEQERDRELREAQWVLTDGQEDSNELVVETPETELYFKAGRRSYGGFNPLVERLLKEVQAELNRKRGGKDETVSDKSMANRYTKHVKEGQTSSRKRKVKSESTNDSQNERNKSRRIESSVDDNDNNNSDDGDDDGNDDEPPPLELPTELSTTPHRQGGQGQGQGQGRGGRGGGNRRAQSHGDLRNNNNNNNNRFNNGGNRGRGGGGFGPGGWRGGGGPGGGNRRGGSFRGGERGGRGFRRPSGDGL